MGRGKVARKEFATVKDGPRDFEVLGLTGGVASGKSLAARFFSEEGIPVIDADEIARELRAEGGPACDVIRERFGTTDPSRLREIVFSDPAARRDLEAILHPLIYKESLKRMRETAKARIDAGAAKPIKIIYEAALLVETTRYEDMNFKGLIVVDAPKDMRKKRLMSRDGISEALAEKMLLSQISDEKRRKAATIILENTGSPEELREKVREFVDHTLRGEAPP